jgi:hypothetical protein
MRRHGRAYDVRERSLRIARQNEICDGLGGTWS